MATPTLPTFVRQQTEQRERQMQTSFPAKVIEYDADTGTVTIEPQFIEAWHVDGERVQEEIENTEDAHIANVQIAFPRAGVYQITFPVAVDDFGLVTCTKYSLDVWRKAATAGDPGDLRRFTMSGAVFHPVNLSPDDANIKHDDGEYISLSAGGDVDFLCLYTETKQNLDDIKAMLDDLILAHDTHVHTTTATIGLGPAVGVITTPTVTTTKTYAVTDPVNAKVKVE